MNILYQMVCMRMLICRYDLFLALAYRTQRSRLYQILLYPDHLGWIQIVSQGTMTSQTSKMALDFDGQYNQKSWFIKGPDLPLLYSS